MPREVKGRSSAAIFALGSRGREQRSQPDPANHSHNAARHWRVTKVGLDREDEMGCVLCSAIEDGSGMLRDFSVHQGALI